MRLKNLTKCYFYKHEKGKVDGEYSTKWKFIGEYLLNKQDNINELDKNVAGDVNFENIKLITDKKLELEKGVGVSFEQLELDDENYTSKPPKYTIAGYLQIGRSSTYTLDIYYGE